MKKEKITIEVWSDVVCPFCYLGKRKLEKAIQGLHAEDKVEVVWRSFQLDPEFPNNKAFPSIPYLSERKGYPESQVQGMCQHISEQGKNYGIEFNFEKALTFNTWDVHRLIQWSKTKSKSSLLKEAFMLAYFSEGVNLSQEENILGIVEKVGLDADEAKKVLQSNDYAAELEQDIAQARELGIGGVPYFVINGKQVISGAQEDRVFDRAIAAALKDSERTIASSSKKAACLPTGKCE